MNTAGTVRSSVPVVSVFPVPTRPLWRVAFPAAVAAALALTGCGGESGPSQDELQTMVAPDDTSGNAANEPDLAELRFDPESVSCAPHSNSTVDGAWQTSAPREKVAGDEQAQLGLRDNEQSEDLDVTVQVITPDEDQLQADVALSDGEWTTLAYPEDFADAGSSTEGTHTVIWTASGGQGDGTFISCDGFRVG